MAEEGITGLVGSSVGEAAAFAAGLAIAPVLEPYLQELRNLTWSGTPTRPLDPSVAADAVAERAINRDTGASEASQSGLAGTPFDTLVETLRTAPDLGTAFNLWRRDYISDDDFTHALDKAKLEDRWIQPLKLLKYDLLQPAQIALGVVRGILKSDGLLVRDLDLSPGNVPRYPVSYIDPVHEAQIQGISEERLRVMVGEIGLPMAVVAAAQAYFRQIITKTDYNAAVSEGDVRPEWGDAYLEYARQILTASQYVEGHLRGWITEPEMYAGTAKHGMSAADTDLLFKVSGRPITIHQITTGLARGGTYPATYDDVPEPYRKSLEEGNIRPEWASLDYANRYSLPSAFVIRALLTGGAITAEQGETLFLQSGWPPALAKQVADFYGTPSAAPADPSVKKAQTQLWTATHKSYVSGESSEDVVRATLPAAGVAAGAIEDVLAIWAAEAGLVRKQLSAAQIKKAWKGAATNDATGQPWTRDEAITELVDRGYSVTDANSFLDL